MARVTYTVYKNSILATIISLFSRMFAMGGVFMAVIGLMDGEFGMVGAGAVMFVIFGIGGTALAEAINSRKTNVKLWKEVIRKQGWEAQIPNSVDVCFQVYNANPNPWTLGKIEKLNPAAAAQIRQALAAKK